MSLFDEIRQAAPWAKDLSDRDIVLKGAEITGMQPFEVAQELGVDTSKRGLFGAANDYAIEIANAALNLPKSALDIASPGTKASEAIGQFQKEGESKQSFAAQEAKYKLSQAMQAEDFGEQAKGALTYVKENPLLAASQAIGSFAGPGFAIKGGKYAAGALGLTEKAAGRVALGAGAATTGTMAGGDAAGDAYDMVMNSPSLKDTPIEERERLATDAARKASVIPFVIGAGTTLLPGAERALATGTRSILKTGATEFASEAFEEGSTKLSANIAAQQYAPEVRTSQGVVGSAVLGGLLGGGTGVTVGALNRQPGSLLQGSAQTDTLETNPNANAINNAIDSNSTEIDTDTNAQVAQVRQQQDELQQSQQQAQQQATQQAQEQRQAFLDVATTYGFTPNESGTLNLGKALIRTPEIAQQYIAQFEQATKDQSPAQKQFFGAAISSGAVPVKPGATPKAIATSVNTFLSNWQIAGIEDKVEAAEWVNTLIPTIEGANAVKEAAPLNEFYKSLTGQDSPAFASLLEQATEKPTKTKGVKDGQLQVQSNAGLRAVSEQGGTTQISGTEPGDVRPSSVQPIQPGSLGAGSLGLQTGALSSGGVPTSTLPSGSRIDLSSESIGQAQGQVNEAKPKVAVKKRRGGVPEQVVEGSRSVEPTQEDKATGIVETVVRDVIDAVVKRRGRMSNVNLQKLKDFIYYDFSQVENRAAKTGEVSKKELAEMFDVSTDTIDGWQDIANNFFEQNRGVIQAQLYKALDENNISLLELKDQVKAARDFAVGEAVSLEEEERLAQQVTTVTREDEEDFEQNAVEDAEAADLGLTEVEDESQLDQRELQGEKTGMGVYTGRTGVSVQEENKPEETINARYIRKTKELEAAENSGNEELAAKLTKELDALVDEAAGVAKKQVAKAEAIAGEKKGTKNAVQKRSTEKVSVRKQAEAGKGVPSKDTEGGKAATEGKAAKEISSLTIEEQASKAWDDAAKEFPDAPKFAELTEEQQADWVSFGEENWTPEDVQTELVKLAKKYSLFERAPKNAWTADKLKSKLKSLFSTDQSFDELVTVVNNVKDLPADMQAEIAAEVDQKDAVVGGFVDNGRVYLLAHNIKQGEELAVVLHELGAHLGLENLLGSYNYQKLAGQINKWSSGKGTPLEVKIAKKAKQRVAEHLEASPESKPYENDELIAYFVEEAILAGVDPTATEIKGAGQIIQFLRSVIASMKVALRKIGFNKFDDLSAKHIVDLAFGAAKLELDGTYHGTRAEFRKFLDEKITTVLSGWGVYTTNLKEESKTYGEKTIRALPLVDRKDLIQNDRPLEDQPAVVKKLRAVPNKEFQDFLDEIGFLKLDGGDLQGALGNWEVTSGGGVYKLLSKAAQENAVDVREIVSLFLDEQGIPGSTFKPYGRGMPNRQTIIFKAKNVNRIAQETAAGTKFSLKKAREASDKQMAKLPEPLRTPLQHMMDNIYDFAKKGLPYFAFTEDLADVAAKYIPSAKKYVNLMKERQAIRTKFERNVDLILQQYDKLPSEVKGTGEGSVNRFLKDSTMSGKWAYNPGWIKGFKEETDIDSSLETRFKALPASAQSLVKSVFTHGQNTLLAMQKAVNENINTEYDALIAAAKAANDTKEVTELTKKKAATLTEYNTLMRTNSKKPYAPLKRFGNYVVVGKSQQYIDNEIMASSKAADPDKIAEARKKLRELEKNEDHYFVQFAETAGEANAIVRDEAGNYDYLENFEKDSSQGFGVRDLNDVFNRLRNMVEEGTDTSLSETSQKVLNRLMADLKLTLLSESSARQSERRRKSVAGAESDMMRAFATQGRATASFIASMENSGDIYDTLRDMKKETDSYDGAGTRAERRRYYNEFMKRHFMGMDYRPSPFTDKALSTTSMWMLLTNPAYYLQNMTQPFMMSLPVMGGKHGYNRSWKEMTRAYTDIASVIRKHGVGEDSYSKLPEDVRNVVEELVNRGRIDISLEQDLGRWRSSEDSKLAKFGQASELLRGMAQDIETINRVATAVAAYRLESKRSNPTNAINYADKIIYTTHGDYSGFNAPRISRSSIGRLATQFRKFQLIQISLMARLFNDAFAGKDADTRLIGKKALGFTIGHTAIMGGLMGLPGFAAIAALYGMVFGDEDEPENPELALRRAIGDDTIADLLLKGVPAAGGVDLSGKLGMGQMLSLLPYTDVTIDRKGVYQTIGTAVSGPFGGLLAKSAEGIGYIGRGDYYKGVEQLVPTGVANAMKGYRFGTEGITSKTGDVTMSPDDISTVDAFMVALGLPTKPITDRQFLQSAKFDYDQFYNEKTSELKREYVRAYSTGDAAARGEIMNEWRKLQESRARNGYTKQPLSTLLKAPQEKTKREKNTVGGVAVNKANRGFVRQTSELQSCCQRYLELQVRITQQKQ